VHTEPTMNGVDFNQVVKTYDNGVQVLHGIDLAIRQGEFVVFVGPSGCGKSTLMRMVAGLESVSGGMIAINGHEVNELPPRERDIAMVFQDYALYPHKNVFDNLAFGLKLRKLPAAEIDHRVRAAAAILKIEHLLERRPRALSGGQRQRVAMGRAIVRQPRLFLFDEPLSNLDALLRSQMRTEIKKLHQHLRTTTIYVTHDQVEAMTLAERIVVLCGGRIMQVGTPDEVYNRPASKFVAGFTGSPPMNFLAARITAGEAGVEIMFGDGAVRLKLPSAFSERYASHDGQEVEFGIRPEDVALQCAGANDVLLSAHVLVVEPLGAETLVTLQCAGGEMICRLPPNASPTPGQVLSVWLDMDKFHLFDRASGEVLRAN
jgi:multiple sugar transport system ATP-binding protein